VLVGAETEAVSFVAGRMWKVVDWAVTAICLAAMAGGFFIGWAGICRGDDASMRQTLMILLPLPGLIAFLVYRVGRRVVDYVLTGR
jgi:hypothetical protein